MDYTNIIKLCKDRNIKYIQNADMKKFTTFKIGGACDLMLLPENTDEIKFVIQNIGTQYLVIGNGSNLLVDDGGIEIPVINTAMIDYIEINNNNIIKAGSGTLLTRVSKLAYNNSLSGLEFAAGIPGSVGGGVYMNCGAYGGEISNVIKSITYITANGEVKNITRDELKFSYRKSSFTGSRDIILEAEFELEVGNKKLIKQKMDDYNNARREKQPINMPSAGSVFKRPAGHFAGQMIDECGLRGYKTGGAMVSEKHCGFIVNVDNASAGDVMSLIEHIKNEVRNKFNVEMETEIKYINGKAKK